MSLSIAEQLLPLQRQLTKTLPAIRQVASVTANLAGDNKGEAFGYAQKTILRWLQTRVGNLPTEAWGGQTFEHMTPGRFAAGVKIELADGEYWSVRCDDPDATIPGRTWTTEISLARQGDNAKFGVRLIVATTEEKPNYIPSIPNIVRQLADEPGLLRNSRPLSMTPLFVDDDDKLDDLVNLLVDSRRKNPVFVISLDENENSLQDAIIDARKLAQRVIGVAHVVVIAGRQAFGLSDILGRSLSVFKRAIRTYRPNLTIEDDPYRHPLALAKQIENWEGEGPEAFVNMLIRTATRNSIQTADEEKELPSFTKVKQIALQYQREQAQLDNDYPALLALAEQELQEKQREIDSLDSKVFDGELALLEADERTNEYEATISWLRHRISEIEKVKPVGHSAPQLSYPDSYDYIQEWADQHFEGRVQLSNRAARDAKAGEFLDVPFVYKCIEYLGTKYWKMKTEGGLDLVKENDDALLDLNIQNQSSGAEHLLKEQGDTFLIQWGASGKKRLLDQHLKLGGNTRDPKRCLRIYYFWDDIRQLVVVGSLPGHLQTRAT